MEAIRYETNRQGAIRILAAQARIPDSDLCGTKLLSMHALHPKATLSPGIL